MIGYRDRTWCKSPNCRNECGRKLTEEDDKRAIEWWGSEDYPISFAYFCDENGRASIATRMKERGEPEQ